MGNCLATPVADGARPKRPPGASGDAAAAIAAATKGLPSPQGGSTHSTSAPLPQPQQPSSMIPLATPVVAPGPTPRNDAVKMHQMKKRIAVAAEAISSAADIEIPVVPKTEYAERLIGECGSGGWWVVGGLLWAGRTVGM